MLRRRHELTSKCSLQSLSTLTFVRTGFFQTCLDNLPLKSVKSFFSPILCFY
jgi:hypothetical protein